MPGGRPRGSVKQKRFVEEYLVDLNATQAAIRAGYKPTKAGERGNTLLHKVPWVRDAIAKAMADRSRRTGITVERVLREHARVAFSDVRRLVRSGPDGLELVPVSEWSPDDSAAVAEIVQTVDSKGSRLRIKLHDKMAALNTLARYVQMLPEERQGAGQEAVEMLVRAFLQAGRRPALTADAYEIEGERITAETEAKEAEAVETTARQLPQPRLTEDE